MIETQTATADHLETGNETMSYSIMNSESARDLPIIVFWTVNGKTERAKHLGTKGQFKTTAEAKTAVFNAEKYGSQNV